MVKIGELRDMSSEQLRLLLKDTTEHLFRLRIQSQTERLDTPSELKKNRLLIARIKSVQRQRELKAAAEQAAAAAQASDQTTQQT
jgi:large subunit ribosomal protein L29